MLDQIYETPDALRRHLNGPLLEARLSYLNYNADQGASKATLRILAHEMLVIIDYLDLDKSKSEVDVTKIEEAANRWISRQPQYHSRKHSQGAKEVFISIATNWLRFLGRLRTHKEPLLPYAFMIEEFADYMNCERGFSKATIQIRRNDVADFLSRVYDQSHSFSEISIAKIEEVIASKGRQYNWARTTIRSYVYSLRAFFRYAEMRGWSKVGLAGAIMSPCIFKEESLPIGPSWEDVQRLIAGIGEDNPIGIRNRAIVMLIAVYGLRSGEVRNLRIEDIDWEREQFVVLRSKQGKTQNYPLSYTVGEAILRYLKGVRPRCQYREIFLTGDAPIQPLSSKGIYSMVSRYLRSLNIQTNHYGPHSLRHACATHLLAEGFPLKVIGDYLGHRSSEATRIYAKVDMNGLREVANFQLGGLL
jgi:integrase/recombinase XerD